MDEETKGYLDAMEARLSGRINDVEGRLTARINDVEARLTARIHDNSERLLNRLTSLEHDFQNAKGFLVGDALVSSRRWLDLEARVAKLEDRNGKGAAQR